MLNDEIQADRPVEALPQLVVLQRPKEFPAPSRAVPEPAGPGSPLLAQLEFELKLDTSQASYLNRILREREMEIRDCHARYRRMGVLDVRDYGWWVTDRRALWFQRVDGVLDRHQHELWVALQQRNLLGQGLEFEVSDGMAVLE